MMGSSRLGRDPARRLARALVFSTATVVAGVAAAVACSSPTSTSADSVTQTVTDQGGVVRLDDVTLEIPPGALSASQAITIARTPESAPSGYDALSAIYRFNPEGLVFAKLATISITTPVGAIGRPSIVWSQGLADFEPLATTLADGRARANISHFSRGFLGTPACEHAVSCTVEGAKCGNFESICDGTHDKERRDDCACAGAAWKCTVSERDCGAADAGPATEAGTDTGSDAGSDTGSDAAGVRPGAPVAVLASVGRIVTTLAGSAFDVDGTGSSASFSGPRGVTVDAAGNVYVADATNNRIRRVTPTGVVTTLAGSGAVAFADGTGAAASFDDPWGVAVDAAGNVYVADTGNNRIRRVTPLGVVTTLAGSGVAAFADGTGTAASFNVPGGITVDAAENVYVADYGNNRIRRVTPAGVVTTLAGSGTNGFADGTGTAASFSSPVGIAVDGAGNVYVADFFNNRIRKVTPAGVVTTLAGSDTVAFADGTGAAASFAAPYGVGVDAAANVYVTDSGRIRKVTPAGVVTTLAGSGPHVDGTGAAARFASPTSLTLDAAGNVFVADFANNRIRTVTPAGVVTTLAGSGSGVAADGTGTAASFANPDGVAVGADGNFYVADFSGYVRKVTSAAVVTTLAGSATFGFADGTGAAARFFGLRSIAVDGAGNAYVADYNNNRIRKVTPAGVVTTLAGSGAAAFADGTGAAASFNGPWGVAVNAAGNVYVSDQKNQRIRTVTPAGVVTTLAGSGAAAYTDGAGGAASFNLPRGLATDTGGNVYVADYFNNRIRMVTPAGVVTTLAGSGAASFADGPTATASFKGPCGVTVDSAGNVYVADTANERIRKVSTVGSGQLGVTWNVPGATGNSPITGYAASAGAPSQATQTCTTAGTTMCTISGLTSGVAYSVSVTATNAAGTSAPSVPTVGTPN